METSKGEIHFPFLRWRRVIIVVTGHPYTGKAQIARCIGKWAGCQVCYVDDFLQALSLEKEYTVSSPPSGEEAERIHHLALDALYRVAFRHLTHYYPGECVVIKSRLSSTFELDLLVNRFKKSALAYTTIIIVECRIQNEYRWRSQLKDLRRREKEEWYKVRSWKDIDKAKEDGADSQSFDFHLLSSLKGSPDSITRLVLDYDADFNAHPGAGLPKLTPDFQRAFEYLLKRQMTESGYEATYVAQVQLKDMRRYLLEKEIDASTKRREYICTGENNIVGSCIFKYWEELELPGDEAEASYCGVCDEKLVIGEAAYTCHFCILNLHSTCAEMALDFTFLKGIQDGRSLFFYGDELCELFTEKQITCKSCNVKGKDFSKYCQACIFEMHLRCGVLPTIIKHDCHQQHFLSLQCVLFPEGKTCNACGLNRCGVSGYVCHICYIFYDVFCIFLPGEVKQEHGGHEHVMKLMYSHEGMDQEDDHWCNTCYQDMDPQLWFYSCQDCPYYVTHALRTCVGKDRIQEAVGNGNLPIQQLRDIFMFLESCCT